MLISVNYAGCGFLFLLVKQGIGMIMSVICVTQVYHKSCFKCNSCSKILDSTLLTQHEDNIYCKGESLMSVQAYEVIIKYDGREEYGSVIGPNVED